MQEIRNSAVVPVPRDEAWLARHEEFVAEAAGGNINLLFIGDSLTDWWRDPERGKSVWDEILAARKAANFGISADRTQHLLWRLQNGEAEGFSPATIILLIGTNNTGMENDGSKPRNTPGEAIEGIAAVVRELRGRFPAAVIHHFALFPRGEDGSIYRSQIPEINEGIRRLADGRMVRFHDIGSRFLDQDGDIRLDLMPDRLHLNTEGYRVWGGELGRILGEPR